MFFSSEKIKQWRRGARQAWAEQFPANTPDGWSISPVDLTKVVNVFSLLRLKQEMVLRAYQYRQGHDGNSVVYAMPAGERLPVIKVKTKQPARPATALENIMEAIDGDGSLESYVQASILRREINEFGALGHGSDWELYHVLGDTVWADPSQASVSPAQATPSGTAHMWQWAIQQPDDFHPKIEQQDKVVKVNFYVYTALGKERIIRFEDTFKTGSYTFQTDSQLIATGPQGYVI